MEQFVGDLTEAKQADAVRACFVSTAIYAALTVVAGSQIFLHSKLKTSSASTVS